MLAASAFRAALRPIGLTPLRGLSQPVELIEVVLTEFASRTYPPLRLDRSDGGDGAGNGGDGLGGGDGTDGNGTTTDDGTMSNDSYIGTGIGAANHRREASRANTVAASESTAATAAPVSTGWVSEEPRRSDEPNAAIHQPKMVATDGSTGGGGGGAASTTVPITFADARERHNAKMALINPHLYSGGAALTGEFAATSDAERFAEKIGRRAAVPSLPHFMLQFRTVRAVTAQLPPSQLRDVLELVCRKWRAPLPLLARLRRAKTPADRIDVYITATLVAKVSRALSSGFAKTAKGGGQQQQQQYHTNQNTIPIPTITNNNAFAALAFAPPVAGGSHGGAVGPQRQTGRANSHASGYNSLVEAISAHQQQQQQRVSQPPSLALLQAVSARGEETPKAAPLTPEVTSRRTPAGAPLPGVCV